MSDKDIESHVNDAEKYKVTAPFTIGQIAAFNKYQSCGEFHPYTCGGCTPSRLLHGFTDGLKCCFCGWNQQWMLDYSSLIK